MEKAEFYSSNYSNTNNNMHAFVCVCELAQTYRET